MNRRIGIAGTAAVLTLLTTAVSCASNDSGSVGLGPAATTTTSPTTTSPTTTVPTTVVGATTTPSTPPTTPSTPTTIAPAPPEDLTGFQTDNYRRERPLAVPPVPLVTGIRAAAHNGFERVVFDMSALPAADAVRFVDKVTADGSGLPVTVAGSAYLLVRLEEAQAHTDAGAPLLSMRTSPGLSAVKEIVMAGDFEGYVTIAIGLGTRTPFRVIELTNPARVVVDVLL